MNVNTSVLNKRLKLSKNCLQAIDRYQLIVLIVVLSLLCYGMMLGMSRPVSLQQQQEMQQYQMQYLYPASRDMANNLLTQPQQVTQFQYFRFLRALHLEQSRIHYQKDEEPQS